MGGVDSTYGAGKAYKAAAGNALRMTATQEAKTDYSFSTQYSSTLIDTIDATTVYGFEDLAKNNNTEVNPSQNSTYTNFGQGMGNLATSATTYTSGTDSFANRYYDLIKGNTAGTTSIAKAYDDGSTTKDNTYTPTDVAAALVGTNKSTFYTTVNTGTGYYK